MMEHIRKAYKKWLFLDPLLSDPSFGHAEATLDPVTKDLWRAIKRDLSVLEREG